MKSEVRLRHPTTGEVKVAPTGFSWTTLLFGGIPAFFFRGDRGTRGSVMLAATIAGYVFGVASEGTLQILILAGWVIVALRYNEWYIRDLLAQGYVPHDKSSRKTLVRAGMLAQATAEQVDKPREPAKKDAAETHVLQQAAKRGGIVSPVLVATQGEYGLDEAKSVLDHLVNAGHAELRVFKKTGEMVYVIPGLLTDQTRDDLEPLT